MLLSHSGIWKWGVSTLNKQREKPKITETYTLTSKLILNECLLCLLRNFDAFRLAHSLFIESARFVRTCKMKAKHSVDGVCARVADSERVGVFREIE